jgi:hypothetical protein
LQLLAVYTPLAHFFFKTSPIPLSHWPMILSVSMIGLVGFDVIRLVKEKFPGLFRKLSVDPSVANPNHRQSHKDSQEQS